MLDSILYWYILPGWALVTLFLMGPIATTGKLAAIIKTEVLAILVGIATYILNKRAVNTQLIPRLKKIDDLIEKMETT